MAIDTERVKQQHAIADVVEQHGVDLRRSGGRLSGRCPFHEDDSPSLVVYPETRSFYCFGCGAGGDVIDFVRRAEGLGFREALERLGSGPGAEAPTPRRTSAARPAPARRLSLDDRLMLSAASELYHETLLRTPEALRYLEGRGIPTWVVRECRLGTSDGQQLAPYLKRRRLSLKRAGELGLLFRGDGETMAGRLVVPELRGAHCAWMVGRSLDDGSQPKYRGLALPKPLLGTERVRRRQRVFVTEGPFDWLTAVSWGLPACALLGTQLRPGALRFLDRARSVVFVLDTDQAGRDAAERLAAEVGDRAIVLHLPGGVKDLNELGTRPGGRETFFRLLDEAQQARRKEAADAAATR